MNWLHFFFWLAGFYFLYYLAMILFDLAGAKHAPAAGSLTQELTFSENVATTKLAAQPITADAEPKTRLYEPSTGVKYEPEMIGSGGVVIDNLFKLCKQEAIIYTRMVGF
jgi:hypothetical protein